MLRRTRPFAVTLFLALALTLGCAQRHDPFSPETDGRESVSPGDPESEHSRHDKERSGVAAGAFFPLVPGNQWDYSIALDVTYVPNVGSPATVFAIQGTLSLNVVCLDRIEGRDYYGILLDQSFGPGTRTLFWQAQRQDGSGLHALALDEPPSCAPDMTAFEPPTQAEARKNEDTFMERMSSSATTLRPSHRRAVDAASRSAAARATRGLLGMNADSEDAPRPDGAPDERLLLSYPLHPGEEWERTPGAAVVVEDMERMQVPAGSFSAYRIAVEGLPEGSTHFQWYARHVGIVAEYARSEIPVTIGGGVVIGKLVSEVRVELLSVDIALLGSKRGPHRGDGPEPTP